MLYHLLPFAISLFLITSCYSASAQIRQQQHTQLRTAMDSNDYASAEQLLRQMMRTAPDAFAGNNYDYLLARLIEQRGANAEARALFQDVVVRNSPLAGYALWHQAEIARRSNNLGEEQKLLQKFIGQHPGHLLRERAIQRLCDSYFKSGQYQSVIDTLRSLSGPRRETLTMIAEAQVALGQYEAPRAFFNSVLTNGSMDDASLRAVIGLDRLDASRTTILTETERLQRARVYQYNRYFAQARKHWLAVVMDFPQSQRRAEALFQLGRGYFLEDKFAEAVKWYDQVHNEFPQTDEGEQGFYFVGHCYQALNDADRAIARYEEFLKAYPDSDYAGYTHLNAIDTLRSAGRLEEAMRWAARAQMNLKEPFIAVTGLFNQAKINLTRENYSAALADFTALKSKHLNGRGLTATINIAEAAFMRGYCLEKLGRFEEAISEYLTLREVRDGAAGYYGQRASQRLQALANNLRANSLITRRLEAFLEQARTAHSQGNASLAKTAANQVLRFAIDEATRDEMLTILRAAYAKLRGYQLPKYSLMAVGRTQPLDPGSPPINGTSHQTLANELLFLGLYDEGAVELAESQGATPTVAFYCARGECAHRAIKFSEPILNSLPEDFRPELMPREWAEVFYPMPFGDALLRHAASRGVDPRFVLSIVRQESRYDPKVKSRAAARGMMQFIALTANQIAAQLDLNDFEQSDLYTANTAILFGAQYLKNLFTEFGSPQAVAAAYNGSEDSVRRWRDRARSTDVDRLVIEVLKRETKDYVFKVMNYYAAYRKIYPNERSTER